MAINYPPKNRMIRHPQNTSESVYFWAGYWFKSIKLALLGKLVRLLLPLQVFWVGYCPAEIKMKSRFQDFKIQVTLQFKALR